MDALLTVGFFGFAMAAWTVIHLHLTARVPVPVLARTAADIDAEFFRIVGSEWRRDIPQPL